MTVFHELLRRLANIFSIRVDVLPEISQQCGYNIMPGNRLQEINLN